MFTNAVAAGLLASAYVVLLILLLNPTLTLNPETTLPLAALVGVFYTAYLGSIAFGLLIVRRLLGRDFFSPAWISVAVFTWLSGFAAAAGAIVMWANISTFGVVLETGTRSALRVSAVTLAVVALLLFSIGVGQRYGGRRRIWAGCVALLVCASLVVPVVARGRGRRSLLEVRPVTGMPDVPPAEPIRRITLIALDGGSLEIVANATAEGRLPNFGRILDAGAVAHLATLHPTSAEAVWAAIVTGKLPQKNGVRSAAVYYLAARRSGQPIQLLPDYCFATSLIRSGVLLEEPRTATALRARTIWTILSGVGSSVGVVNFPLTYPAPPVRGFVVSDTYLRTDDRAEHRHDLDTLYPPTLHEEARLALASADEGGGLAEVLSALPERYKSAARTDRFYDRLRQTLTAAYPVQVSMMRFQSLDPIGHYFLRYAMPTRFGDVNEADRRRYGGILEAHYAIVDEAIGRAIAELRPDDLLLVLSGFGMEPLGVGKRLVEQAIGDPEISGTHEAAPDGFLLAYGASVTRARQLRRGSIVDVLPTMLYFLGLPVGRDMDGYTRTDLFVPAFTEERPITFIPSYDR